jgi:hypothetical protein
VSVFLFVAFMLLLNKFSSTLTKSRCSPFISNLSLFSWTFLMTYSKAKLKSSGYKADLLTILNRKYIRQVFTHMCLYVYVPYYSEMSF